MSWKNVHTWTVDNPLVMRDIINMGVDAFITDCPDTGKKYVKVDFYDKCYVLECRCAKY